MADLIFTKEEAKRITQYSVVFCIVLTALFFINPLSRKSPKNIFEKRKVDNKYVYIPITNELSGNNSFSCKKDKDTVRIFIIGDSVAQVFGRNFEDILNNSVFGVKFEVINCGIGGSNSLRTRKVFDEIVNYNADLVIVFSGSNEFHSEDQSHRLIEGNLASVAIKKLLEKIFYNYGNNLRSIAVKAKKKKIPIILSTLPFAMKDYPPKGVQLGLYRDLRFAKLFLEEKKYNEAVKALKTCLNSSMDKRLAYYYMGTAYENINNIVKAKEYYYKAIESTMETWPCANFQSNEIVRKICNEENVDLIDLEKEFISLSDNGIVGNLQMRDNTHWYDFYDNLVADLIINKMVNSRKIYNKLFWNRNVNFFKVNFKKNDIVKHNKEEFYSDLLHAIWTLLDTDFIEQYSLGLFCSLYTVDRERFDKISFLKKKIKQDISEHDPRGNLIKEIERIDKIWPDVLYCIAETYRIFGLPEKALVFYDKAIKLNENNYLYYLGRAIVYYSLNDMGSAYNNLQNVESLYSFGKTLKKIYMDYFIYNDKYAESF